MMCNDHFLSIGHRLTCQIPVSHSPPDEYVKADVQVKFEFRNITCIHVYDIVSKLKMVGQLVHFICQKSFSEYEKRKFFIVVKHFQSVYSGSAFPNNFKVVKKSGKHSQFDYQHFHT